jgi:hypothetical protein
MRSRVKGFTFFKHPFQVYSEASVHMYIIIHMCKALNFDN